MADTPNLAKLVPGFDFLQSLAQGAGSALPGLGQWVAPTLDPKEIDKRIEELRTVQFWLEQNAKLIGTTIQALQVQRMTLSTLQTMNVQMDDLRESLTLRPPAAPPKPADQAPAAEAKPLAEPAKAAAAATVDPMQWWTALTQQFTQLAGAALREGAAAMPKPAAKAAKTPAAKPAAKKSKRKSAAAPRDA